MQEKLENFFVFQDRKLKFSEFHKLTKLQLIQQQFLFSFLRFVVWLSWNIVRFLEILF